MKLDFTVKSNSYLLGISKDGNLDNILKGTVNFRKGAMLNALSLQEIYSNPDWIADVRRIDRNITQYFVALGENKEHYTSDLDALKEQAIQQLKEKDNLSASQSMHQLLVNIIVLNNSEETKPLAKGLAYNIMHVLGGVMFD